ncbi:MAG: ferritin-like domain-containing protein [Thermodesulfobacteriota bacterium]
MTELELLIKYLNDQLASEYEAVFTYLYYSAKIEEEDVGQVLMEFAHEELEHACLLTRMILNLGGDPILTLPQMDKKKSLLAMLVFSQASEDSAIKKYQMIRQLLDDPQNIEIIDRTIEQEKKHHQQMTDIFETLKEIRRK